MLETAGSAGFHVVDNAGKYCQFKANTGSPHCQLLLRPDGSTTC